MKSGVIRGGAIEDAHCGDGAKAEMVYPKPLAHKLTSKYVKQIEKKLETYGENPTMQYTIATEQNFMKKYFNFTLTENKWHDQIKWQAR